MGRRLDELWLLSVADDLLLAVRRCIVMRQRHGFVGGQQSVGIERSSREPPPPDAGLQLLTADVPVRDLVYVRALRYIDANHCRQQVAGVLAVV